MWYVKFVNNIIQIQWALFDSNESSAKLDNLVSATELRR